MTGASAGFGRCRTTELMWASLAAASRGRPAFSTSTTASTTQQGSSRLAGSRDGGPGRGGQCGKSISRSTLIDGHARVRRLGGVVVLGGSVRPTWTVRAQRGAAATTVRGCDKGSKRWTRLLDGIPLNYHMCVPPSCSGLKTVLCPKEGRVFRSGLVVAALHNKGYSQDLGTALAYSAEL